MGKKSYSGGFRLTLETARWLAVQEFGTAKGLEPDRGTYLEGYFRMELGNLVISISPDTGMSGCIVVRAGLCTASHTFLTCPRKRKEAAEYSNIGINKIDSILKQGLIALLFCT